MKETLKKALTKQELTSDEERSILLLKSLKEKMLMSILQGSMACNGVYFNRYRNFKGKDKLLCQKILR